jgi:pyrroloquinoline quinone (PQQ) biosynthesis protein C
MFKKCGIILALNKSMEDIALQHDAVHHSYLQKLSQGEFSNMEKALAYFASQYEGYSLWFPKYLQAVIDKLSNPSHKSHLLENLAEEKGQLGKEDMKAIRALGIEDSWVVGIPHPILFQQFKKAICTNYNFEMNEAVLRWRTSFLNYLDNCTEEEAVGAIGLGTESVVKQIYRPLIESLAMHTSLTLQDYVFFPLHTEVDDEHGKVLLAIANELASQSEENAQLVRKGMETALDLRAEFWTKLELETNAL